MKKNIVNDIQTQGWSHHINNKIAMIEEILGAEPTYANGVELKRSHKNASSSQENDNQKSVRDKFSQM